MLIDAATGEPWVPNGSMGFRYAESGEGKWNLDLDGVTPALSLRDAKVAAESAEVLLPHFSDPRGEGGVLRRGVPVTRVNGRLVTTVFDLMLAQYGVGPSRPAGRVADRLRRRLQSLHPGLAGRDHQRAGRGLHPDRPRVRRQLRGVEGPVHDHHGRRHLPVVPRRRHVPLDPESVDLDRRDGSQRWRLGPLRRPGEVPADHRLDLAGQRPGLVAAATDHDRDRFLVHAHRPVAFRRLSG